MVQEYLVSLGYEPLTRSLNLSELIKRPKISLYHVAELLGLSMDKEIADEIEIEARYAGYIEKSKKMQSVCESLKAEDSAMILII